MLPVWSPAFTAASPRAALPSRKNERPPEGGTPNPPAQSSVGQALPFCLAIEPPGFWPAVKVDPPDWVFGFSDAEYAARRVTTLFPRSSSSRSRDQRFENPPPPSQ